MDIAPRRAPVTGSGLPCPEGIAAAGILRAGRHLARRGSVLRRG